MTYVRVRYSKDGGYTFSDARQLPLGELGDYLHRVVGRRFGTARHWVWDISITDPVVADLVAASVQIEAV